MSPNLNTIQCDQFAEACGSPGDKMKRLNCRAAGLPATRVRLAAPLLSQLTSGNLVGTVYDPTDAVVPGEVMA